MRRLLAAALLAASVLLAPSITPSSAMAAPATTPAEVQAVTYKDQLLGEINTRRARVGTDPLVYAAPAANQAVDRYLADLTPLMQAYRTCFHGMNNPVAPSWDYVAATGLDAEVGGEVLGCPGDGFYWTPQQIADGWWNSPSHFRALYGDPTATALACGTYGVGRDGRGYRTVACVTYRA